MNEIRRKAWHAIETHYGVSRKADIPAGHGKGRRRAVFMQRPHTMTFEIIE
jgi:hypothetical protein